MVSRSCQKLFFQGWHMQVGTYMFIQAGDVFTVGRLETINLINRDPSQVVLVIAQVAVTVNKYRVRETSWPVVTGA